MCLVVYVDLGGGRLVGAEFFAGVVFVLLCECVGLFFFWVCVV